MPRLFVTGLEGFVGAHLAREAVGQGWDVVGTRHPSVCEPDMAWADGRVRCRACNLLTPRALDWALREEYPDAVVHLAAVTFVPQGEGQAATTLETNVTGSLNLLEAVLAGCPGARVLLISSGQVYGGVPRGGKPLSERAPIRPETLYGVSKAAMELVGAYYWRRHGLDVVVARPFNHVGPGQSEKFVAPSFARQIAVIEATGGRGVVSVGNLHAQRDFTDVRDVVKAYMLLLGAGRRGVRYNVCSGTGVRVGWLLEKLLEQADAEIRVEVDHSRLRGSEAGRIVGDNRRVRRATGWLPEIALEDSMRDILRYWRKRASP